MKVQNHNREKGYQKASFTVEAACLLPIFILVFVLSVWGAFYYHDKNILSACAYETAVAGSDQIRQKEEVTASTLEAEFQKRVHDKCILFGNIQVSVQIRKEQIVVNALAQRRGMKVSVVHTAAVTEPESYIREMKRIE